MHTFHCKSPRGGCDFVHCLEAGGLTSPLACQPVNIPELMFYADPNPPSPEALVCR